MTRPTSIGRTFPRVAGLGIITTTIGDLADVDLTGIADGDIIVWDDATDTWVVTAPGGGSLTDHTHAATGSGSNGGGATLSPTTLNLPATASPSQTTDGEIKWDSDDNVIAVGDGAATKQFGYLGSTTPSVESGSGSAGSSKETARADHVHPADGGGGGGSFSGARVWHNTTQNLTSGSETALVFNSENFDDGGWHDTSSNTGRLTVPSGVTRVAVGIQVRTTNSPDEPAYVVVRHTTSGPTTTDVLLFELENDPAVPAASGSTIYHVTAGDYFTVLVFVNNTGKQALSTANSHPIFWIYKLG